MASKEFDKIEEGRDIKHLLTKDQKDLFIKLKNVLKSVLEQFREKAFVTK